MLPKPFLLADSEDLFHPRVPDCVAALPIKS